MWSGIRNNFRRLALTAFAGAVLVAGLGILSPESAQAATLYISEFASPVGQVGTVQANVYPQPAITDQTVAITGASVQSAAFNAGTHAIQVECDADCSVIIGTNPTATTSNYLMGDGVPYQFVVVPGQKIAVISNTSGGSGSDVNIVAVGGNAVTTSVPVSIVAGSALVGTVGIDQTTTGTTNGVTLVPSANSPAGITPVVSAALESNHVIKAGAGNLYGAKITTGATAGWLLVSNSTTAPTAGGAAIAPLSCTAVAANTTTGVVFSPPMVLSTGITLVFSTTGQCLTNTASATAFFEGYAK